MGYAISVGARDSLRGLGDYVFLPDFQSPAIRLITIMKNFRGFRMSTSALLCFALLGCDAKGEVSKEPQKDKLVVDVMQVVAKKFEHWVVYPGRTASPANIDLKPQVTALVREVHFHDGAMVQEGQLLFTLDKSEYEAAVATYQAKLAREKAQLNQLGAEFEQAQRLWEKRVISKTEFDRIALAASVAKADLDAASARLRIALKELTNTEIRSPITARIGKALLTPGNVAVKNDSLLAVLVSVEPIHIYFESDDRYANTFESERAIEARVIVDGKQSEGVVDFANNAFHDETGTLQYRAVFSNSKRFLRPGQFVEIEVQDAVTQKEEVAVPEKVVLTDQHRRFVWVLNDKSQAVRRYVEVGHKVGTGVIISEGLSGGETILVSSLHKLTSGLEVTPTFREDSK